jgi:Tfp pilus assembly protein PilN
MRAVNLIPAEQRKGSNAGGKSGGAAYALLGALALAVALFAAHTVTNGKVRDKVAQADAVEAQATAVEAKAGRLASYQQFTKVVQERTATVQGLAAARFDWGRTLEQVSQVVPSDVALTQMQASGPGTGGDLVSARSALSNPAIEMLGCAPSQARVALLMARLRRIEGVQRVALASSEKADGSASSDAAQSSESVDATGGCQTSDQVPQFGLVVFFGTPTAATTAASGSSATQSTAFEALKSTGSSTSTTPGS